MAKVRNLLLAGAVACVVAAPAFAAPAGRTISRDYTITRTKVHLADVDSWVGTQREFFRAEPRERWVTVALQDDSGHPVSGRVEIGEEAFAFCSSTERPLRVRPGGRVAVSATLGTCGAGPSIVSAGTITVTFSGHPR